MSQPMSIILQSVVKLHTDTACQSSQQLLSMQPANVHHYRVSIDRSCSCSIVALDLDSQVHMEHVALTAAVGLT
jgi:hypothetical protein